MKTIGVSVIMVGLLLLTMGVAEAWYPYYPHSHWYPGYPRTRFGFGFVVPVYPYPSAYYPPVYSPPPVYVPQCSIYTAAGYYRQVPWYTEGGFTTFRWEWVPPTTTQICR